MLARKGCPADTIDHLIYARKRVEFCAAELACQDICRERCTHKRERFHDKVLDPESLVKKADLIVADEVSVLGRTMGEDLLSFNKPLLVLGDICQLPAIGDAGYFTSRKPDYHMTVIHRQAAGSPIIRLAARAPAWRATPGQAVRRQRGGAPHR